MSAMTALTRRRALQGLLGLAADGLLPRLALAALPTERRTVVILLRGALDGVAAVVPTGDPHYAGQRGAIALAAGDVMPLDGTFGLNPGLAPLKPLWDARELLILHAIASPYRERSHFDGQNLLENGTLRPQGSADGWLNRALGATAQPRDGRRLGLAVGGAVPLLMRGTVPVASWEPQVMAPVEPALLELVAAMYQRDPVFGPALAEAIKAEAMSTAALGDDAKTPQPQRAKRGVGAKAFKALATSAGKLLAAPAGARVAALDMGGWDTHANQGATKGRLFDNLGGLADGVVALKAALGPAWRDTVVVVITEFGRTVAVNGTGGTDHGTATAAWLIGGAVDGGRVIADWPGLAPGQLHQGRDLKPTADLRALLKAVLQPQLQLSTDALGRNVFPDSAAIKPLPGVIKA
ncbi:MAG: DUF1501 domain-containing protein [Proteobacteria bacterium]|nr:DUF1501 domain-containing protein [Pseudomonadota bacterium]